MSLYEKSCNLPSISAHMHPFWIACSEGHVAVAKILLAAKPEILLQSQPSALWISCSKLKLECAEFLMNKMSPKQIARPGPDGTTPLMQLLANTVKHKDESSATHEFIRKMTDAGKFEAFHVMETSICFDDEAIFETLFDKICSVEEASVLGKSAVQAENVAMLKLVRTKYPTIEVDKEVEERCQTKAMRSVLGIQTVINESSELMEMSSRFPKFNEGIEVMIEPLDGSIKFVDLKKDIDPLLKDRFCSLKCFGKSPKSMPIWKWKKRQCNEGEHKR